MLLGAAVVALTFGLTTAFVPIAFFVGGFLLTALFGWGALWGSRGPDPDPGEDFRWGEAVSYWGVAGGALFLHHLDRLMTPELLSFEALATFNVLAAVGAAVGARWGLEGLLHGVGVGWIGHSAAGFALSARHLTGQSTHTEASTT